MLVWTGRGILIVIVYLLSALGFDFLFSKDNENLALAAAALLTAAFSWYFGSRWNNKTSRIVVDEETGERFEIKDNHTLFWIKMQYYGLLFCILSIVFLAKVSALVAVITSVLILGLSVYIFLTKRKEDEIVEEEVE